MRRADQGLPGYPVFLQAMQEKKGNWQPLQAHDDTTNADYRQNIEEKYTGWNFSCSGYRKTTALI